jgi:hypothetical protein
MTNAVQKRKKNLLSSFAVWGAEDSVYLAKDRKGRLVSAVGDEIDDSSNNTAHDKEDDIKH